MVYVNFALRVRVNARFSWMMRVCACFFFQYFYSGEVLMQAKIARPAAFYICPDHLPYVVTKFIWGRFAFFARFGLLFQGNTMLKVVQKYNCNDS